MSDNELHSISVGADLGILLNIIHQNLKERSKLAIAQKDYKPNSKHFPTGRY